MTYKEYMKLAGVDMNSPTLGKDTTPVQRDALNTGFGSLKESTDINNIDAYGNYMSNPSNVSAFSKDQMDLLSNPDFAAYAGDRGVDLNTANIDQLGKDFNGGTEWGVKEWGTVGNLGLGAGQLGLGLASYFENKKTADAQRKLLGQQYDSNAEAIADRRANKEALSKLKIK